MYPRFLLALVLCAAARAQTPTFQSGVSQVRVDAEVLSGGRPVSQLVAQHFLVKDNGVAQPVVHVTQNAEQLDLILLFDVSGSMKPTVERVATSTKRAFQHLREGDRVAVMTFASRPRLISGLTEDLDAAQRTVEQDVLASSFDGSTRILDGLNEAGLVHFRQGRAPAGRGRRRAVLIITDNYGEKGHVEESRALENLLEAEVIVSAVIIPNPGEAKKKKRPVTADFLAMETGGDTLQADDPGEGFQQMIERLRSRYSVYYNMPKGESGEFRAVKLELQGVAKQLYPAARVYARKGYKLP